ncbi:MAG TPA: LapA family protein [Candidatus Udaeobacter sp.]|nr:LapA family protein [Candidatus Udaeobacter sp.]
MRRLSFIISLPLFVVLVVFAVDNRGALALSFWPLPWAFTLPVFVALFLALLIGFLAGAVAAWLSGGRTRRRLRDLGETARAQGHQIAEQERRNAASLPPPRS